MCRSRYSAYCGELVEYIADTTSTDAAEFTGSRSTYVAAVRTTARRVSYKKLDIIKQVGVIWFRLVQSIH